MVTDAWFDKSDGPTRISFADLRKHALGILEIVGNDSTPPHAATATKSPAAATDNDKPAARERADYQRAAADKKPAFDASSIWVKP